MPKEVWQETSSAAGGSVATPRLTAGMVACISSTSGAVANTTAFFAQLLPKCRYSAAAPQTAACALAIAECKLPVMAPLLDGAQLLMSSAVSSCEDGGEGPPSGDHSPSSAAQSLADQAAAAPWPLTAGCRHQCQAGSHTVLPRICPV